MLQSGQKPKVLETAGYNFSLLLDKFPSYPYYLLISNFIDPVSDICINLLDFELFTNLQKLHSCFVIREKDEPYPVLTDHLVLHFIELPKFKNTQFMNGFTKWLGFLKYEGKEGELVETLLNDEIFQKAHDAYNYFTSDDVLRDKYLARKIWKMDHDTNMELKLQKREQLGEQKGKVETAKNMYTDGLPLEKISKYTGFSCAELKQILNISE